MRKTPSLTEESGCLHRVDLGDYACAPEYNVFNATTQELFRFSECKTKYSGDLVLSPQTGNIISGTMAAVLSIILFETNGKSPLL